VVRGDLMRLTRVVDQLLNNAIKYSPAGGDIEVAITIEGREATISVKDQGVGIPKAKHARIFERFYRAHTDTAHDYGGMGVGLYLAREIIAQHGGRVWFESEEARGSTFHIVLPLLEGGGPHG
jgi:signal transduction histidine kinase